MLGNPPTRHGATRTKQAPLRWADIPPKPLKFWMKWWCPGAELNHRHTDFQSVALPTELPGHGGGLIEMGARPVQRIAGSGSRPINAAGLGSGQSAISTIWGNASGC